MSEAFAARLREFNEDVLADHARAEAAMRQVERQGSAHGRTALQHAMRRAGGPLARATLTPGDSHGYLMPAIATVANDLGYRLDRRPRPRQSSGILGMTSLRRDDLTPDTIWLKPDTPVNTQVRTGLHELAHAVLNDRGREFNVEAAEEVIVETVAYLLADDLGLDARAFSVRYVSIELGPDDLFLGAGEKLMLVGPEVERVYSILKPLVMQAAATTKGATDVAGHEGRPARPVGGPAGREHPRRRPLVAYA